LGTIDNDPPGARGEEADPMEDFDDYEENTSVATSSGFSTGHEDEEVSDMTLKRWMLPLMMIYHWNW